MSLIFAYTYLSIAFLTTILAASLEYSPKYGFSVCDLILSICIGLIWPISLLAMLPEIKDKYFNQGWARLIAWIGKILEKILFFYIIKPKNNHE
jgi:hypothetical protein